MSLEIDVRVPLPGLLQHRDRFIYLPGHGKVFGGVNQALRRVVMGNHNGILLVLGSTWVKVNSRIDVECLLVHGDGAVNISFPASIPPFLDQSVGLVKLHRLHRQIGRRQCDAD